MREPHMESWIGGESPERQSARSDDHSPMGGAAAKAKDILARYAMNTVL